MIDTHTDASMAALRAEIDLIPFGFDTLAWWWMRLRCSV
jgi:hypothetical protein